MSRQLSEPKICALYSRLSRDDEGDGTSNSIINQQKMLADYAAKNSFTNTRFFSDDGYSGVNYDRPAWKEMIAEVEKGNVLAVICKDLSRAGRNYLETGFYTEVFFREKGVRFIAIANNVDTDNRESAEFAPFLNIMSEWYARDSSRKVKTSLHAKAKRGERIASKVIYGYMKDPNTKGGWIIDDEVAPIVRRIFQMTIEGIGPRQIADILSAEKIDTPGYHMTRIGVGDANWANEKRRYFWRGSTISAMLAHVGYAGHTHSLKTENESYKSKRKIIKPKEEWLFFENTHPAIIEQEIWDMVQKCRTVKRRTDTTGEANPLTGLVFCSDCGKRMYNHRHKSCQRTTTKPNGKSRTFHSPEYSTYCCSTHAQYKDECTSHYINSNALREIILETIKMTTSYARNNESAFMKIICEASKNSHEQSIKHHKQQIVKNEKRIGELDNLFKKIYEDFATGTLNAKRFKQLSDDYESEQEELERQTAELKSEVERFGNDSLRGDKFLGLAKRYTEFSELTTPMIHEFIDKIVVYQADKSSGKREQRVDVYLNYIGQFAPMVDGDCEVGNKSEKQRAIWRDYKRKQRAKKKKETAI